MISIGVDVMGTEKGVKEAVRGCISNSEEGYTYYNGW